MRKSSAPSKLFSKQVSSQIVHPPSVFSDILNNEENHIKELEKVGKDKQLQKNQNPFCETFNVIFGKQTSKKHKTFEEDGLLVIDKRNKTATLQSVDGKVLNSALNFSDEIEIGAVISIGNKLVEIGSKAENENKPAPQIKLQPFVPLKRKIAPLIETVQPNPDPVIVDPPETQTFQQSDESSLETYIVTYGKKTTKMHKTFENDGILVVDNFRKIATLKSSNEKIIGCELNFKFEISVGSRIEIEDKLVEIIELKDDHAKPQKINPTPRPTCSQILASPPKKKFKSPFLSTAPAIIPTSSKNKYENLLENSENIVKKSPAPKNLFVLPEPSFEHQWKFNIEKKPVTQVIVPDCLAEVLRPHQKEGVTFLYKCVMGFNSFENADYFGCILADEMGIGKTLQCITLIYTLLTTGPFSKNVAKKVLIVTPSSLLINWDKEIIKWLSNKRVFTHIVDGKKCTIKGYQQAVNVPIMLISYEMFSKHVDEMENINFDLFILDEGHRLKNTNLKMTQSLNRISCKRRILLTGTPFQNDMSEFYALINFVNPDILGTYQEFKTKYETPIVQSQNKNVLPQYRKLGEERSKELHDLTSKFILRRTQEIIQKYLPKKQEIILFIRPQKIQRSMIHDLLKIYEQQQVERNKVLEKSLMPLELIILLKKLCNHPFLLSANQTAREKEILKHLEMKIKDFHPKYSGKLWVMVEFMNALIEKQEKVVVISYYTQTLDMLENVCRKFEFKFIRMDGKTKTTDRSKLVKKFNDPEDDTFVFLLSAKTGGVGLNLIGASRLVLFDNDWNPSNDLQALARIYREGQQRDTYVYRMITCGTIEEKIYQRQITKTALSGRVVDTKKDSSSNKFSDEELKDLFGTENLTFDSCNTHEIIQCSCDGSGIAPGASQEIIDEDLSDDDEVSPYQIKLEEAPVKKKEALKMHELMKWQHHNHPISDAVLEELCLKNLTDHINFIFKSETVKI